MRFATATSAENSLRAEPDWPPVVVGGAFQTGVNLMRDLLRRGVRTVAVDYDLQHQGFRSVYGKTYHCPNPDLDGPAWCEFMKHLSDELGQKPVVIPAADVFIMALGKYAPELTGHYLNSPEAAQLQAKLCSKETQYALCEQHGYPCPKLAYLRSGADLEQFLADSRPPYLLKPLSPRAWEAMPGNHPAYGKKVLIGQTATELRQIYSDVSSFQPQAIAQEVIAGLGDRKRNHVSVSGKGGEPLGHCMVKSIRPYPVFTGMTQVVQPFEDDVLAALCQDFLRKIGYRGICEFEFKLDERNGQPLLIEINPRFSGTGSIAGFAGVETGWLHYLDMIGLPVVPVRASRLDFSFITLQLEASDTLPLVLTGLIPWRDFFASYLGNREYFDFDWKDYRIALETVRLSGRYAAGGLWRHLRRKRPALPTS